MTGDVTRLNRLRALLQERGWELMKEGSRFFAFRAPHGEKASATYELLVPRDPTTEDFSRALDHSIEALATYYRSPIARIEALLLPASRVMSVRLAGEDFAAGAAPFMSFERFLEHLKRTISRTAAFLLTDDPVTHATPHAARDFLYECWFMQTARGSFVARVALPTGGTFGSPLSLFSRQVEKAAVVTTIQNVARFVGTRVLEGDESIYTDEGLESASDVTSVGVLEEFSKLLHGSSAQSMAFAFDGPEATETIDLPSLTLPRLERLDNYIGHVRERLRATFYLRATGQVTEVRRSRRKSSRSMIGISASVEGRPQLVTFGVGPSELPTFLDYYQSRAPVAVEGTARRMRTQVRIENNLAYSDG